MRLFQAIHLIGIVALFPLTAHAEPEPAALVLSNVVLVGREWENQPAMDVLVRGSTIAEIQPHGSRFYDSSAAVIDLTGRFIIPGLIDCHQHISPSPESALINALHQGITALRDMGGDGAYLKELQDAVQSGELVAPDIYFSAVVAGPNMIFRDTRAKVSTPVLYRLGEAPWMRLVDDSTDLVLVMKDAKQCGATGIKVYEDLSPGMVARVTAEAHRQGLRVWSHAYVGPATVADVVASHPDVISHRPRRIGPVE